MGLDGGVTTRQDTFQPVHWMAWVFALLLSLLCHWFLLRLNPNLLLGQGGVRISRAVTAPPMRMDDVTIERVKRELPSLLERFAEQDVDLPSPIAPDAPGAGSEVPGFDPAEAEQTAVAVQASLPKETQVDLLEPPSDWQPYQEIMQVTEARFADDIVVLPRQYRPRRPESPRAPDLVLPSEMPPADLVFRPPAGNASVVPSMSTGVPGGGIPGLPGLVMDAPLPPQPQTIDSTPLPDLPELIEERREDVTGMTAVEDLLGIETHSFVDPAHPRYRYFKIQIFRKGIERLPVLPREVFFMLDCSESMTNAKLRQCVDGLNRAIDTLSPMDLFNIMTFREKVETAFPTSQPADIVRKAQGRAYLENLRAYGRTDIFASLQRLRETPSSDGRPLIALLVTDGRPTMGLMDSSDIIENFTQANQSRFSVFTVGGGRRANKYLLDFLGYRNRGGAQVVEENRDIPQAIHALSSELRRPVLADLQARVSGVSGEEIFPRTLTHLYLDRPLVLVGRVPFSETRLGLQIVGTSGTVRHDMVFTVDLREAPRGTDSVRVEWAWQAIFHRIGRFIASRSDADRRAVEEIAREYGISVPYAYSLESPMPR